MKKLLFILIILILWTTPEAKDAKASNVSFEILPITSVGENLDVIVTTETDEVLINSIEMIIDYDENLLSFSGYGDENAVVQFWIDPPHEKDGKIYFSGIIPGGVLGLYDAKETKLAPLPLVHLFFRTKNEGIAKFSFIDSKILQHDGLGTPLVHEKIETDVIIKNNPNNKNITKEENNEEKFLKKNTLESSTKDEPLDLVFWIIIIIIISGIIWYKLLRYKT